MSENRSNLRLWKWLLNMRAHARLGVAASIIASFGIGVAQGSRYLPHYEIITWSLGGLLVVCALLLLRRQPDNDCDSDSSSGNEVTFAPATPAETAAPEYATSVFTRRYWGWVSLCCGVVAVLATPPRIEPVMGRAPGIAAKKTQPPPPPVKTNRAVATPPEPVKFPELKLQGIHLHPSHPAAIINGKTCVAGDVIAGAIVVEVNHDSVVLEMGGQKRLLELSRETRH